MKWAMEFKIELHRVGKAFNGCPVFSNFSSSFLPGMSYVIAGPNGSGKSTLLRIICGLSRPSSGDVRVEVEGKLLNGTHEKGRFMGYLSPDLNLYDRLTAFENLFFFASLRGTIAAEQDIVNLLDRVQLKPFIHRQAGAFSSGMKQRLKLAFAVLQHPPVLLLDEPSTNLDNNGREMVEELIDTQRQEGTVISASNEPGEVEKYRQEIFFMGEEPQSAGMEGPGGRV